MALGEGVLGGGVEIVIQLDSGQRRALLQGMQNVMAMWEKILVGHGVVTVPVTRGV